VPLLAPGSRVLTPEVALPLGLTFEGADAAPRHPRAPPARAPAPRSDCPAPLARPRARQAACQTGPGPGPRRGAAPCAAHTAAQAGQASGRFHALRERAVPTTPLFQRPCCCGRPGRPRRGRERRRPAAGGGGGGRRQRGARRRARGGPAARHHGRAHPDGVPHSQPDIRRCARGRGLSGEPGRAAVRSARSAALLSVLGCLSHWLGCAGGLRLAGLRTGALRAWR